MERDERDERREGRETRGTSHRRSSNPILNYIAHVILYIQGRDTGQQRSSPPIIDAQQPSNRTVPSSTAWCRNKATDPSPGLRNRLCLSDEG